MISVPAETGLPAETSVPVETGVPAETGAGTETQRLDSWQGRLDRALGPVGYACWAVATILATALPSPHARPLTTTLPVAAAALAFLLARTALDRFPAAAGRTRYSLPLFLGLLTTTLLLVLCDPWFGFFSFAGYVHAARYLHGPARLLGVAPAIPASISQTGSRIPSSGPQLGGFLAVLTLNLTVIGVISALASVNARLSLRRQQANAELTEANRRLTETLAENAGLHAQLVAQAREAGIIDERQRLARELHDTVAQGLAGIVTQLQAADQAREQGSPAEQWQRHLDNAAQLARQSLTQARRAVHALRPEELDRADLVQALAELTERWGELHQIRAGFTVTGEARPLHPEVEVTLLRTAQESLANVAKHAEAGRVGLTLSYMPELVTLDIRDDGVGFDPRREPASRATGGGYGLGVMRTRAQLLAGRLEIETEPNGGTTVSVALPALARAE
ncbi:two-component sensor histidine kinase [Kitasatospora sp. MMS16-BH015]|uniref:sensor histidine kinase n=1 Tax=Kitasatospora sp. MMS16-BH015 TaxID=2018025 RepID=UPI000CA242D8|nr:sensor histidine kinase [Kitasatospora sp. MMS16-BH015]AUG77115.1 two-component sensor histidine kinase [Kitasatospora sp. MMS16-BH015]